MVGLKLAEIPRDFVFFESKRGPGAQRVPRRRRGLEPAVLGVTTEATWWNSVTPNQGGCSRSRGVL